MNILRKAISLSAMGAALLGTTTMVLAAECPDGFPSKPINYWVGYGAGGGTDTIARALASEMESALGWTVIVQNKPGASSSVMMSQLAVAPADGYTIGVTSSGSVTKFPYLNKKSPYTKEDFDYPGTAQEAVVSIVAAADAPFNNFEELLEFGRAHDNRITIAAASGSVEIFTKAFTAKTGVTFVHVPTKGSTAALQSVLGGHVDITLQGTGHVQHLKAGKMKQVFTIGDKRPVFAPDAKTTVELGYDLKGTNSYVLFAMPKNIDPAVKTCIETALADATNSEAFAKLQANFDQIPTNLGPVGTKAKLDEIATVFEAYYAK